MCNCMICTTTRLFIYLFICKKIMYGKITYTSVNETNDGIFSPFASELIVVLWYYNFIGKVEPFG